MRSEEMKRRSEELRLMNLPAVSCRLHSRLAALGHVIKAKVSLERVSLSVTGRRPPLLGRVLFLRPTPRDLPVVVEEPAGPEQQGGGVVSQQGGPGSDPARLRESSCGEGGDKP